MLRELEDERSVASKGQSGLESRAHKNLKSET